MAVTRDYREWILELLRPVGSVSGRAMFGGYGLYMDGLFFALIADDTLYYKVDDSNRGDFVDAGMRPFAPMGEERPMPYYEVPPDVLESSDLLREWTERAVGVARRGKGKKKGTGGLGTRD